MVAVWRAKPVFVNTLKYIQNVRTLTEIAIFCKSNTFQHNTNH